MCRTSSAPERLPQAEMRWRPQMIEPPALVSVPAAGLGASLRPRRPRLLDIRRSDLGRGPTEVPRGERCPTRSRLTTTTTTRTENISTAAAARTRGTPRQGRARRLGRADSRPALETNGGQRFSPVPVSLRDCRVMGSAARCALQGPRECLRQGPRALTTQRPRTLGWPRGRDDTRVSNEANTGGS